MQTETLQCVPQTSATSGKTLLRGHVSLKVLLFSFERDSIIDFRDYEYNELGKSGWSHEVKVVLWAGGTRPTEGCWSFCRLFT